MNDRDCESCKHHKEVCRNGIFYHSCESWDCEFEPKEDVEAEDSQEKSTISQGFSQDNCISRQAVEKIINDIRDCISVEGYWAICERLKKLPPVSSSEKPNKWIPIKTRPLTKKEKEEYADLGYSEDSIDSMYDCPLPEDGEEVFITTRYDEVTTDTFYRDEGCYFETYCDKDDVKAWMSLPEPYKAEGSGEE